MNLRAPVRSDRNVAAEAARAAEQPHHRKLRRSPRRASVRESGRWRVHAVQVLLALVFLAAWQYLPKIPSLRSSSHLFDPYFISSPWNVANDVFNLFTGHDSTVEIWPYLWPTLWTTFLGTAIGLVAGGLFGLVLSSLNFLGKVFRPYIVAINAVPRIAIIPVLVLLVGPTPEASVLISVGVVFFVAFFSAFEGGTSVPPQYIQNVTILGASRIQTMRAVRLPYVLAWTLASLPLAITWGLLSVITGEILTGYGGIGDLVSLATVSADATRTYALVVILAALGLIVVNLAEVVKKRVLHWWGNS